MLILSLFPHNTISWFHMEIIFQLRDHAGETAGLSNSYGNRLAIYGGDDRISKLTNKVKDGDKFKVCLVYFR